MKKIGLLIGIVLLSITGYAQQDPHYTMYMYNMNIVNPAYAGSDGTFNVGLLGRQQWVGVDGAPSTFTANIHSPLKKNLGGGLSVVTDNIGPLRETNAYFDLSYMLKVSKRGKLSFGIKLGGSFFSLTDLNGNVQEVDTGLDLGFNRFFPNVGTGFLYHTDKFYFGVSAPNLLNTRHRLQSRGVDLATEKEHIFGTSGYVFDLNENLKLKPSTLVKIVPGSPLSIDLSLNLMIREIFELGISNRLDDSWSAMFNILLNDRIRLGYAYDYTFSNLGQFNNGSHELLFLYSLPLGERKLKSPRYF